MRSYKKLRYLEIERMSNWGWHRLLLMFVLISHFLFFSFPLSLNAQQKRTTKRVVKKTVKSQKPKTNSQNTTSVQALEKQRQQIQQQIKEQERRLRNNVQEAVLRHDWALQLHGFHADPEAKTMRFDVVLNFEIEPQEALKILSDEMKGMYPDYTVEIVPDVDISD